MNIEIDDMFSPEKCIENRNKLYVFGENQAQQGDRYPGAGQACIRGFDNAFGFCTLTNVGWLWDDRQYWLNKTQIDKDIADLLALSVNYDAIVFPKYGLGTGRASLYKSAPITFLYMCVSLLESFKYNNIEHLSVPNY